MKRIFSAALICAFAFGCNNEAKKEEAAVTVTDTAANMKPADTSASAPMASTPMPDSATMMKNWQAYMTPGDVHKMMASWDGKWNGDVTMWMMPGAPPQTSKSTTINKMIMGGRYQQSMHSGSMMGMPFEGMGTLAYDNARRIFISTWIDNMGTGVMKIEGPWDETTKTMTLKGRVVDPGMGTDKEMDVRETFQVIDDKNQLMEMFVLGPDGKEFKTMQIKFTKG